MRYRRTRFLALRDAPTDTGEPSAGGGGAPANQPPAPPAAPAAFDPSTLTPEARAYLDSRIREADTKARTSTRDNAAKAAREELLKQLAGTTEVKPEELAKQLQESQAEIAKRDAQIRAYEVDKAVSAACKPLAADDDLVGALLAKRGALKDLDPSAGDFAARVADVVKKVVEGNPRLKLDGTPVTPPPGGRGAVAPMNGGAGAGGGEGRKRPSTSEAVAALFAK